MTIPIPTLILILVLASWWINRERTKREESALKVTTDRDRTAVEASADIVPGSEMPALTAAEIAAVKVGLDTIVDDLGRLSPIHIRSTAQPQLDGSLNVFHDVSMPALTPESLMAELHKAHTRGALPTLKAAALMPVEKRVRLQFAPGVNTATFIVIDPTTPHGFRTWTPA